MSSSSTSPVIATLGKVRYAATTLSKVPALHSSMNSARERDLGTITSAIEEREDHSFFALWFESGKSEEVGWNGEIDRISVVGALFKTLTGQSPLIREPEALTFWSSGDVE